MKGSRSGYRSAFDPRSIDGCQLWLDAADPATLTLSGSNVTAWADKSGNGNNATAGSSPYPTYASSPSLRSNAIFFNTPDVAGSFTGSLSLTSNVATVFTVYQTTASNVNGGRIFSAIDGTGNQDWGSATSMIMMLVIAPVGATHSIGAYRNSVGLATTGAALASNTPYVFCSQYNGSSISLYQNGSSYASDSTSGNLNVVSYLFGRFINGYIGEYIVYNTSLTTTQRQLIEGYLSRKWGIQSSTSLLPATHPYKYGTPGFVPTSISGCSLWLDAADSSSITLSGSNVTAWNDKSGSGNNPTFGSIKPTYSNNQVTTAYLDATYTSNRQFSVPSNVLSTTAGSSGSVFFVFADLQPSGLYNMLFGTSNTSGGFNQALQRQDAFSYGGMGMTAPYSASFITAMNTKNTLIYNTNYAYGTSNVSVRVNGTSYYTTVGSAVTPPASPVYISSSGYGDAGNQRLYEILFFTTQLTTSQIQQVEGYLAWKWGTKTTTLPATHPYVSIPPTLRPFAPIDVPGCALWLDAADSSTLTLSGSNVTAWADKSGNGYNLSQSVAGNQPTYSNSVINFTAASSNVLSNTAANGFGATGTVFAVLRYAQISPTMRAISIGGGNTYIGFDSDTAAHFYNNTSGYYAATSQITSTVGTRNLRIAQRNGAAIPRYAVNGGTLTNMEYSDAVISPTSHITVGTGGGGIGANLYMTGHIAEIIGYTTYLSDADIRRVEGYLAKKWGLQANMPTPHPYRYSRPFGFTPTTLSNCALWLDAADASSITLSGSNVTAWADKSGNGNNATATGTIPYTATINGVSALSFTGATSTYLRGSLSNSGTTATGFAVFVMNSSSHSNARILSVTASGQNDYSSALYAQIVGRDPVGYHTIRTVSSASTVSAILGNPALTSSAFTGSSNTIYLNGTAGSTVASTGNFGYSQYTIGTSPTEESIVYLNGSIGEILVFHASLTAAQRQQVEGYLAWKWGLQRNLPTGHPYQFGLPPLTAGFTPIGSNTISPSTNGTAFLDSFLTTSDQTMTYTGASLSNVSSFVSGVSMMDGNYIRSAYGTIAPSATTGQWYSYYTDPANIKVVKFQLTLTGSMLTIKALSAGYTAISTGQLVSSSNSGSTNDTYYATYTTMPIASSSTAAGYGVRSILMYVGTDPRTISGCQLWLDAADQATVSATGTVTSATLNQFVTTNDQAMSYSGTISSLSTFVGGTSTMRGAWITAGLTSTIIPSSTSGQWYSFVNDGVNVKVVKFQLTLSGSTLNVKALNAGYSADSSIFLSSAKTPAVNDINYASYTSAPIATTDTSDGYGIKTLAMTSLLSARWVDKISSRAFTGTAFASYGTLRLNGLPTIAFDGTNRLEDRSFPFPNTQCTIYAIAYLNSGTSGYQRLLNGGGSTFDALLFLGASSGNYATFTGSSSAWNDTSANSPSTSISQTWAIVGMTINTSVLTPYLNGTAMTTKTGTMSQFLGLTIGGTAFGAVWNGQIAELLVFSSVHSTNQRQQVEGYLAHKWGLVSSLPSNHPYRLIKP